MISENLFKKILLEPAVSCNQLKIISGYASPAMANKHISNLPPGVSVSLVVGMVPNDGIGRGGHNGFQALNSELKTFSCNYVISPPAVHIKSYVWLKNGVPKVAFTGSGNYSQNAFFGRTIESFAEDDPVDCDGLFNSISKGSINCLDSDVERKVKFYQEIFKRNYIERAFEDVAAVDEPVVITEDCVDLSLLSTRDGQIHNQSGLNWGQRAGREPNQAYIPIPSVIARSGFFPNRANHFTLITDDGFSFDCVVAQDGDKALETPKDNSIMGKYFRRRLGVPLGSFVNTQDLYSYGRTNVKICKIDDETYYLDFSV